MEAKLNLDNYHDVYFYDIERFNDKENKTVQLSVLKTHSPCKVDSLNEVEKVLITVRTEFNGKVDNGDICIELTKEQAMFLSANLKSIANSL